MIHFKMIYSFKNNYRLKDTCGTFSSSNNFHDIFVKPAGLSIKVWYSRIF